MTEDYHLSPRQKQILFMLASGYTEKMMANALGISVNTVKRHRGYMFKSWGAANAANMVAMAFKAGVLT